MNHPHGKFCFRCGGECIESTVTEVPEGQAEPARFRVWTCPRGCPGEQGRQLLPPEPEVEAASAELLPPEEAGSGTGRYPEGTHWSEVSDGTGYPEDGTRIREAWPTGDQKAALPAQNKLPE